ncbi:MAG: hypothetical protein MZV64_49975 [Ignavibacteriales bacterium]|nr:hypothetical protein [Ignavibacteriales bacterium]
MVPRTSHCKSGCLRPPEQEAKLLQGSQGPPSRLRLRRADGLHGRTAAH